MSDLTTKCADHKPIGDSVCQQMVAEIEKIGFSKDELKQLPIFDAAQFSLQKDPYTASENLVGSWLDNSQQRIGHIQFLSDGSFYAEYDVVKPHPTKKQWFVEAMTAWGKGDDIKTEAKLLPMME